MGRLEVVRDERERRGHDVGVVDRGQKRQVLWLPWEGGKSEIAPASLSAAEIIFYLA